MSLYLGCTNLCRALICCNTSVKILELIFDFSKQTESIRVTWFSLFNTGFVQKWSDLVQEVSKRVEIYTICHYHTSKVQTFVKFSRRVAAREYSPNSVKVTAAPCKTAEINLKLSAKGCSSNY